MKHILSCRGRALVQAIILCAIARSAIGQSAPPQQSASGASVGSYPERGWVETSDVPVKVYRAPDRKASVIGFILKGQRFPVLVMGSSWYGVNFRGTMGWIDPQEAVVGGEAAKAVPQAAPAVEPTPTPVEAAAPAEAQPDTGPAGTSAPEAAAPVSPAVSHGTPDVRRRRVASTPPQQQSLPLELLKRMPALKVLADNIEAMEAESAPVDSTDTLAHTTRYVEIRQDFVPVLKWVAPGAPTLGMARVNERHRLRMQGKLWSQIEYADTLGWVEGRYTRLWVPSRYSQLMQNLPVYTFVVLGGLLSAVIAVIVGIFVGGFFIVRRVRRALTSKNVDSKVCCIIAASAKTVESTFGEHATTLEKCFSEVGFSVDTVADPMRARTLLSRTTPDVVCADWDIGPNIQQTVNRLLGGVDSSSGALIVYYNVPDPQNTLPLSPREHFLGVSFSDRDLFRIVTPGTTTQTIRKVVKTSVESHALEGDVSEGSLSEVFQFIEMGRRNGCLLIDLDGRPFGMIGFTQGMIVYAVAGAAKAADAVLEILAMQSGHFRFLAEKVPPSTNAQIGALAILMEWTRRKDEASRR